MIVTKGDLIAGTYSLMRISGLTVDPSPEDTTMALSVADDYAAELKGDGLDLKWQSPASYGESDPADTSGLTPEMAGPFKKLLMVELVLAFGREITPTLSMIASKGMRALENIIVSVPDASNPGTLPFGSGNEWSYNDRRFYSEPAVNNDAHYGFEGDIFNYVEDFSDWLVDETLVSVVWEVGNSGLAISNDTFTDTEANADLAFNVQGGYTVCITATKTNSNERLTRRKNFVITACQDQGLTFNV